VPLDRDQTARQIDGAVAESFVLVRRKVHMSSLALAEQALGEEIGGSVGRLGRPGVVTIGHCPKVVHLRPFSKVATANGLQACRLLDKSVYGKRVPVWASHLAQE
jgi:hypothetical protein